MQSDVEDYIQRERKRNGTWSKITNFNCVEWNNNSKYKYK